MVHVGKNGAHQPDETPSHMEQEAAERDLARAIRPAVPLSIVGSALLGSVAFALLLASALGIFVLLFMGATKLLLDEAPSLPEGAGSMLRTALVAFAVLWPALFVWLGVRRWRREIRRFRLIASGEQPPRTLATFRSTRFNTTETKDTIINGGCFGDDVVRAIIDGLAADGFEVDEDLGVEDFGWCGRFQLGANDIYDLIASFQPEDDDGAGVWWVHIERTGMPFSANRRHRDGAVQAEAARAVHAVLARTDGVASLRWHFDGVALDASLAA